MPTLQNWPGTHQSDKLPETWYAAFNGLNTDEKGKTLDEPVAGSAACQTEKTSLVFSL